jgi:hypothetical protein
MAAILIIFCIGICFIFIGNSLLKWLRLPPANMATAFFAGEIISLVWLALVARFINLNTALYGWLILLSVAAVHTAVTKKRPALSLKTLGIVAATGTLVAAILWFWWNPQTDRQATGLMQHRGSLHTLRSMAITQYIIGHNQLPGIGQNFGQNLLVCLSNFLKSGNNSMAITSWIALNAAFFVLLVYEWLRASLVAHRVALAATSFVMLCGVSLSFTWSNLIDIGNPLIVSGYADNYLALASLLLLFGIFQNHPQKTGAMVWAALLCFAHHIYAPQNTVALFTVLAGYALYTMWRRQWSRFYKALRYGLLLVAIAATGYFFGGMLLAQKYVNADIAAAQQVAVAGGGIRIVPHLVSKVYSNHEFRHRRASTVFENEGDLQNAGTPVSKIRLAAAHLEASIWESGRLLFFPLVLLLLGGYTVYRKRNQHPQLKLLLFTGAVSLLAGWLLAYWLAMGPYKMELNRFLYPGTLFSLLCFPFLQAAYANHRKISILLWVLAIAGMVPFFVELLLRLAE